MTKDELFSAADKAADAFTDKGVSAWDVYVRSSSATSAEVKEQKLDAFEEAVTWGAGVRALLPDGRMGFAYSSGSPDAALMAARKAYENALNAEPDAGNNIPLKSDAPYPDITEFDDLVKTLGEREKIDKAMVVEKAALDFDPRIKRVRKSSASFTEAGWAIVSSNGVRAYTEGTYFSCGIMAVAEEGGESQMGYDFDYKRYVSQIDFAKVGRSAAEKAVALLGAKKTPTGLFPVLLDNLVASEFLGVLAASFSAESVIKGRSLLAGKVGQKVCSGLINIHDDALFPGGVGTRAFDDEGFPSQRTPLIVAGELAGFLHNAYTAKRTGGVSTGNAARGGFRTQPGVGSSNLYIEKGKASKEELIASMSKGLLVEEVLGMHTANPISGDFSIGVSGQWIEGGKIAYPVREGAIAGNILSIFSEVEALGSDLRFVGKLGAPSILLKPISVSGS